MSKSSAKLVFLVIATLLASLVLESCASAYFYDIAVARRDKSFLQKSPDLKTTLVATAGPGSDFQLRSVTDHQAWLIENHAERISLKSDDGLGLVAWFIAPRQPSTKAVMLAHGYSGRGWQMAGFAQTYLQDGYAVLMPDARGHGDSEGNYIGFGWPERRDWVRWANWLVTRLGNDTRIVLHGVSMGGATVMMTSGEADLTAHVKVVVEDCGYTSVYEQLAWSLQRMYKLPLEPIMTETSNLTKQRAAYSFTEASALEQVKKTKLPILFIHGEADTFVQFAMVQKLYDACPTEKELFTVAGAGHALASFVDPVGYSRHVKEFIARFISD